MQNVIKSILVLGIILTVCYGLWGCKGGKVPELGDISGPATVDEYGYVEYSVSFVNATGATFLWSCDPADAGKFDKPDLPKTGFTASMVTHDTPVKISVMVDSLQSSPVILSRNITIRDATKLSVGEIEGPDTVDEGTSVTYSIAATDDTGITYQWSAISDDLGMFENPDQPLTQFTAAYLDEDTPVEIQVTVESDNYGRVLKKKQVTIKYIAPYGWACTWGGDLTDYGLGVAIDETGNAYVTGFFCDTVDFDPGDGVDEHTSNGMRDIFLGKFDSAGVFQWACTWGGVATDGPVGVAIDGTGNVYVAGYFTKTVDFDPGPGVAEYKSNGWGDTFLSKFDSNGEFQWARTWGGSVFQDNPTGVTVDANGNAYITGLFHGTVDFDPGLAIDEHTSNGGLDIFLSKFDSNGEFQWAITWGGINEEISNGVGIDGSGNAYVTGYFKETMDFDPGPGVDEHTSNGLWDTSLSKFDSNGEFQWARTWGGSYSERGYEIAVDGSDNAYVTGEFHDTVDLDPGPGVDEHTASSSNADIFLSKFDSNGDFQWGRTWGGSYIETSDGTAIDGNGYVYVTGVFYGTVNFDPGPGVDEHTSNGGKDIFLTKFDSNGEFQWVRTWGGNDFDVGEDVAVDGSGNTYVTGHFTETVDFDPGPGIDEHISNGSGDIFLTKFLPDGTW